MKVNMEPIIRAAATGVLGAAVGWAANGLTLGGRVTAIEQALVRIEARLYAPQVQGPAR